MTKCGACLLTGAYLLTGACLLAGDRGQLTGCVMQPIYSREFKGLIKQFSRLFEEDAWTEDSRQAA